MTFAQLHDGFYRNAKVKRVDSVGKWMWVASIGYANEHLTDGFVPVEALGELTELDSKPRAKVAAKLVEVGLWETAEGGWKIHDFLNWNLSREQVLKRRAENLARVNKHRGNVASNGESNARVMRYNVGESQGESQPSSVPLNLSTSEPQNRREEIPNLSPTPSGVGTSKASPKALVPDAPRNEMGGEEQEVYDALVGDRDLAAAVKRPGDLAKKLVAAYPSKAVAEEIRKAVAWSSAKGRPIRKATFLTNWLANAEEVVEEPLSQWEKDIHREQDERIAKLRLQRANPELYPPPKPWQPPNAIPHDPDAPKITLADLLKKRDELMATMNARADAACKPIVDAQNGVKP